MSPLITVCTASYNRAHTLSRLHASLAAQEYKDFEWLIMDDGSTDGTEALVDDLKVKGGFPIRYEYLANGGKHMAINRGALLAQGRVFFVVDSDDAVPKDALGAIARAWPAIEADPACCGLIGYKASFEGGLLSSSFPRGLETASSLQLKYRRGVRGDKAEVLKTEVQRAFPYPEIPGEGFVTEDIVYNRIAAAQAFRLLPQVLYLGDYLPGGLTARSLELRVKNPRGALLYYQELRSTSVPGRIRIRAGANLWRIFLHQTQSQRAALAAERAVPRLDPCSLLLGRLLWLRDKTSSMVGGKG